MPLTTEYQNSIHPVNQVVLDAASENLVPMSVALPFVARTELPADTQTKTLRKKGELQREVVPENAAATIQEYIESSTLLNSIKSVVTTRHTVEADDFSRESIPSILGEEAAKALAVGLDEDIVTLFSAATSSIVAAAPNLSILEILAAGLNVKVSTRGHAVRRDGGLVFIGSSKQVFDAIVVGGLDPALGLNLHANAASSLPAAVEQANAVRPANGFYASVLGIDLYETEVLDDDGTNYFGAVINPRRAIAGMWSDQVRSLDVNDVIQYRMLKGMYMYSDFAIHWDEAICRVESPL